MIYFFFFFKLLIDGYLFSTSHLVSASLDASPIPCRTAEEAEERDENTNTRKCTMQKITIKQKQSSEVRTCLSNGGRGGSQHVVDALVLVTHYVPAVLRDGHGRARGVTAHGVEAVQRERVAAVRGYAPGVSVHLRRQ